MTVGANDSPRSERFCTAVFTLLSHEKTERKDAAIDTLPDCPDRTPSRFDRAVVIERRHRAVASRIGAWEPVGKMTRFIPFVVLLSIAGCTGAVGPDSNPLVWTATYPKPYQEMTYCLNAASTDYRTVLAFDAQRGIGGVELIAPASGFSKSGKAGEFDVRRVTDRTSQVTFRSAVRTVGGSTALEDWARRQADSCAQ